jgi:hypothetical protein
MTKKFLVSLIGLVMCIGILEAQEAKPYSYTFTKAGGDCLFTGKTFDEVWEAAANALLMMKYTITVAQKDAGMLTAKKGPSTGQVLMVGMFARDRSINLMFKKRDNGISVLGNCKAAKKRITPLYEQMVKLLYVK